MSDLLPHELCDLFKYNPETGILCWKVSRQRVRAGQSAGYKDGKGRLRVEISGKSYPVSHVAFAMHHGRWPADQVDHINQDKTDNRICNLREATNAQNSCNRKSKNKLGVKGVSFHKGRYIARIQEGGKPRHLGSFDSLENAARAYRVASAELHGDFSCPTN